MSKPQIGKDRNYPCEKMDYVPKHPGIDLIFVDVPENLPVLEVSPRAVPDWNKRAPYYFESVFVFASYHLTDLGTILIMHPKDLKIERILHDRASTYNFRIVREWWAYNPLPMVSTGSTAREVWQCSLCCFLSQFNRIFFLLASACSRPTTLPSRSMLVRTS